MAKRKRCEICSEEEGKYKCPTCLTLFCSVACNKRHKQATCNPQVNRRSARQSTDKGVSRPKPPASRRKPVIGSTRPHGMRGDGQTQGRTHGDAEEANEELLSRDQLGMLDEHAEVQRKFGDERVKAILRRVDAAPDRAKALEKEMADPAFLEFCDDILEALGIKQAQQPLSLEEWIVRHCSTSDE